MAAPGAPLADWTPPPFPPAMVLGGAHVRLDPLAPGHAAALHAAFAPGGPGLWTYMAQGPFADAAATAAWIAAMAARPDLRAFALTARGAAGPAGVAALMRIEPAHGTIEVGSICLGPALQRTTAASEAIFLLADWAFAAGYRRLEWKCDSRNAASRRAARRFGFSFEGVFRHHMVVKRRRRDTAWYAITAEDHPALRAAWAAWLDPANRDAAGRQRRPLGAFTAPLRRPPEPDDAPPPPPPGLRPAPG